MTLINGLEEKKYRREYYLKAIKRSRYKKEYNLSLDDLDKLLKSQNNCCLICSIDFSKTQYNIDHNHITGKIRGALCNSCNRGIGFLKDSFELLVNAAKYIQEKDNISV